MAHTTGFGWPALRPYPLRWAPPPRRPARVLEWFSLACSVGQFPLDLLVRAQLVDCDYVSLQLAVGTTNSLCLIPTGHNQFGALLLEDMATKLEDWLEAIATGVEVITLRLETIASRLEAGHRPSLFTLEAIATRVEAIVSRLEPISTRVEAIRVVEHRVSAAPRRVPPGPPDHSRPPAARNKPQRWQGPEATVLA